MIPRKELWQKIKNNNNALKLASYFYNCMSGNKKKIKGSKNTIDVSGSFLKSVKFNVNGFDNQIVIKPSARLPSCNFNLTGNNHKIFIGENCIISNQEFHIEDNNCIINIGARTILNGGHFAVTEPRSELLIGRDCLFSKDIEIRTGDSHTIYEISNNLRINYAKNINIGDHVWLGAHVRIFKGVNIANNTIIANSSLVTKSTEKENCIIAGFPAKVIKENVNWKHDREYDNTNSR